MEKSAERYSVVGQALVTFAELSIKHLFFLTGGAAIALLAFTGDALDKASATVALQKISQALYWWGVAAALAVLVPGLAYAAQLFSWEGGPRWPFHTFRVAAITSWLVSLFLFYIGVQHASMAMNSTATAASSSKP